VCSGLGVVRSSSARFQPDLDGAAVLTLERPPDDAKRRAEIAAQAKLDRQQLESTQ
jgi:hypothetical protein